VLVADNGTGIPPGEVERIFEVFASTKGSRGTGLGLPVSQKIVREHGGQIRIASEVGKGSTFTIEIPTRKFDPMRDSNENMPTLA
jgi:two-component system NtrC family sensor kinase